jgi:hypothetical protein
VAVSRSFRVAARWSKTIARETLLRHWFAVRISNAQAGRTSDLFDLAAIQQSLARTCVIERDLDARRAGIKDRDTFAHEISSP